MRVMRAIMNYLRPYAEYLWRWRKRQLQERSDGSKHSSACANAELVQLKAHIWRLEQMNRQQGFEAHMYLQKADESLADYKSKVQQLASAMRVIDTVKAVAVKMLVRIANSARHIHLAKALHSWKARYVAHRLERMRDEGE